MVNQQIPYNYLRNRFQEWNRTSGHLEKYVDPKKRQGLANEFQKDVIEVKQSVCPYIREMGYTQSKSLIVQAAEGLAGTFFGFPILSTADIVLGALMDVCGFVKQGDRLIQKGV